MSGRGQHTIPKYFLKSFASSEKPSHIWLHRRGLDAPKLVSLEDATKQRDFYSVPSSDGTPTLDDNITKYESNRINSRIDQLRSLSKGLQPDAKIASEVAVHLAIRSSYARTMIRESVQNMVRLTETLLDDPSLLFDANRLPAQPTETLISLFSETIKDRGLDLQTGVHTDTLSRLLYFQYRESAPNLSPHQKDIEPIIGDLQLFKQGIAKSAQTDVLSRTMAPEILVAKLTDMQWEVTEYPDSDAVLPDCVCVCRTSNNKWQPLFLLESGELDTAILPLSPSKLLVGTSPYADEFDLYDYNQVSASICLDFFLCSKKHEDLLKQNKLGEGIREKICALADTRFEEALQNLVGVSNIDRKRKTPGTKCVQMKELINLSFRVVLQGFGDKKYAQTLGNILEELVTDVLPSEYFQRLDGFIFSNDYPATLREIGHTLDLRKDIKTSSGRHQFYAPTSLIIEDNGTTKMMLLGCADLAETLISGQGQSPRIASSAIAEILAGAYLQDFAVPKFPKEKRSVLEDPVESFLFSHVNEIFNAYFAKRSSQHVASTDFQEYQKALLEEISATSETIVTRREQYRTSLDLDDFVNFTLHALDGLLRSAARVLGLRRASKEEFPLSRELNLTLSDMGMLSWLDIYDRDLEAFFQGLENWTQFEDLLFANRHLERWLAQFGIFVFLSEGDQIYIHIPHQNFIY